MYFNSQPHEEADELGVALVSGFSVFQLTASRRGWHKRVSIIFCPLIFQLTASRRGWRYKNGIVFKHVHFNSQPHEEADGNFLTLPNNKRYFNSQPHEEADDAFRKRYPELFISTHSLTKRLTFYFLILENKFQYFNSQPHEEADIHCCHIQHIHLISTHSLTKRLTWAISSCAVIFAFQLTASRRGWLISA